MFKQREGLRRETYPMAPSGEGLLGVTAVSFSEGSILGKSESLTLGIHFKMSM